MTLDLRAASSAAAAVVIAVAAILATTTKAELHFNVHVLQFGGSPEHQKSQFGASAILHKTDGGAWAIFGAPKGYQDSQQVTGTVYRCPFSNRNSGSCIQVFPRVEPINALGRPADVVPANMSFGFTMGYDDTNNRISVCAPRTNMKLSFPKDGKLDTHLYTIGSCFLYEQDFSPRLAFRAESELRDPDDLNSLDEHGAHYVNSMREMGFSIAINKGKYLFGAPGYQDWSGKSIYYENEQDLYPSSTTPVKMSDNADYAGYSVDFIRIAKKDYIVHGAPRRHTMKGEVIITELGATPNSKGNIYIGGTQYGEYFGAAVAVGDFNGDGFDDLLVGAPFNSPTESGRDPTGAVVNKLSKGSYDIGVVYVYYGRETGLELQPKVLNPESKSVGGRFGSTISVVGDLNKDGCDDIAIGAPFEQRGSLNSGAVYIFMGSSKNGLTNENREVLVPPASRDPIRGFGYSISRGFDVTGNKYPDFAVGAVLSGHGFVYRNRPVIILETSISGNIPPVPEKGGNCQGFGRNDLYCFPMVLCAKYSNPGRESIAFDNDIFIQMNIVVDSHRVTPRGFIKDTNTLSSSTHRNLKLEKPGAEQCIDVQAYILPAKNGDILTPIEFRMTSDLVKSQTPESEFCASCPVVWNPSVATAKVTYEVNCKHPGCLVYLHLKAGLEKFKTGSIIPLGRLDPLNLQIEVTSETRSDTAFRTEVEIKLRKGFKFNNPDKCIRLENRFDVVVCTIDNQFEPGEKRDLSVKLQVDTDIAQDTDVGFEVILRTDSKDTNAKNNHLNFTFNLVNQADVGISGTGLVENVLLQKNTSFITLDHIYTVTKYMESIVDRVDLAVRIPMSRKADSLMRHPFISFIKHEPKASAEISYKCTPMPRRVRRSLPEKPLSASLKLPTSTVRHLDINCKTFYCMTYSCTFGPFNRDQSRASLHFRLLLNISDLIEQTNSVPEQITYRTDGNVVILDEKTFKFGEKEKLKSTSIQTVLVREGRPIGEEIDWWWLLLAVIVGLIVVLIMFYALYKCGFFKRGTREDLEELQKEQPILSQHHSPINNMVDVDDNDNNSTFRDSKV